MDNCEVEIYDTDFFSVHLTFISLCFEWHSATIVMRHLRVRSRPFDTISQFQPARKYFPRALLTQSSRQLPLTRSKV
jgi:hypothetical protein